MREKKKEETQADKSQLSIIHANGERKERERLTRLKKLT